LSIENIINVWLYPNRTLNVQQKKPTVIRFLRLALNLVDIYAHEVNNYKKKGVFAVKVTPEEREMLERIENNQFTGGAYKRATFVDKVCHTRSDKMVLEGLRQKGLIETGLGGTVAGDVYDGCWLTSKGKEVLGEGQATDINRKANHHGEKGVKDL